MIRAVIYRKQGKWTGYEVSGHAGYREAGEDIYCAAVSILTFNTANAIEALTEDTVESSDANGRLICQFPNGLSEKGKVLVDAMVLGLEQIEETSGKKYLKVKIQEV
jgi:uncharacterized protein YsxB (DUF464 family)